MPSQSQTSGATRACMDGGAAREQANLLRYALMMRGQLRSGEALPLAYIGVALTETVMHEVGHTLGLRHNFKASR